MRRRDYFFVLVILIGITITFGLNFGKKDELTTIKSAIDQNSSSNESFRDYEILPKTSDSQNYDIIENIFNDKLNQYDTEGYFFQSYEPSLQATYYALYILKSIGKLESINQTSITEYILSHYNNETYLFMDQYAYRYLNIDFDKLYYPYTSILEINCYAILSLAILNNLMLIDTHESINFIWSCYNPSTSGFIGRPYDLSPTNQFRVSTMDNTYYAIITLDMLMDNWDSYSSEKVALIDYINYLQSTYSMDGVFGGFFNDVDTDLRSLGWTMWEPNLLSAYYCIKSLEIFGVEDSIDTDNFHQYLQTLYDDQNKIFQMASFYFPPDKDNIVASALGLQLSDLTPFNGEYFLNSENRSGIINFILTNRNSMGNWDSSTSYEYYELIDTFQIVRGLDETGVISQLTSNNKDEIAKAISNYYFYDGYALLSKDYVSLEQYYTVINSFYHYGRISDINLHGIYEKLRDSCLYSYDSYYFYACTNMPLQEYVSGEPVIPSGGFRSYPVEYYNTGWNRADDHKSKFMALDTLKKIFKLDDFEQDRDLSAMLNDIINSQFLESGYSNYGAFLPSITLSRMSSSFQNSEITLEHSYYAIKSLELLVDYLNLGPIEDLDFDEILLYNYIIKNIQESSTEIYYEPHYSSQVETLLLNTYYMITILKSINMYNLDNNKIKNFVVSNLDYTNIKNFYYSYKISEILNLSIDFNIDLGYNLVQQIYSPELHEFFTNISKKSIEQEAFLWICDMAKNDKIRINCQYSEFIMLGATKNITVSLSNIVLRNFGHHYLVKYESNQIGTIVLDNMLDSTYQNSLTVPIDPKNSPQIVGNISVYKGLTLVSRLNILFRTYYVFSYSVKIQDEDNFFLNEYDVSYRFSTGYVPTPNTRIFATILKNNMYKEVVDFGRWDYSEYSTFTLLYEYPDDAEYSLNVTLVDQFHPEGKHLYNLTRASTASKKDGDDGDDNDDNQSINLPKIIDWQYTIGLGITIGVLFAVIIAAKIRANEKLKKSREREGLFKPNTNSTIGLNNQQYKSHDIGFSNSNNKNKKSFQTTMNNDNLASHNEFIQNIRGNSLINVLKRNKKEVFLIIMGILVFTLLYFYGELLFYFMMGGIGIVILGGIVAFYGGIKKGIKISGIGLLILIIGVFIFALRHPINLF